MRFIDEKGRVLRGINIFDLIVLALLLIMVVSIIVFQVKRSRIDNAGKGLRCNNIYRYVKAEAYLMSEVAAYVKKGERIVDDAGDMMVEIADIVYNEPFFVETVKDSKTDEKLKVSVSEKKDYSISCAKPDTNLFVGASIRDIKDSVELPALRRVVVSLKVLCKVYSDNTIKLVRGDVPLRVGPNIDFSTNDYTARFTIIEIE